MKRVAMTALAIALVMLLASVNGCLFPVVPVHEEPYVVIDEPPVQGTPEAFGDIVTFGWRSGTDTDPMFVRYLVTEVVDTTGAYDPSFNIVGDLNENPWRYEDRWSKWIAYNSPFKAGRSVTIGDDEVLEIGKHYIFAVQARGIGASVTETFEIGKNVRRFFVISVKGPLLLVGERYLGVYRFIGTTLNPVQHELPPAVPLEFKWQGDASSYGGEIISFRYGWDVQDLSNPDDWAVPWGSSCTEAPVRKLYAGVHSFFVEATDNLGKITLAQIMIEVTPFPMTRNLLWVDDFYSTNPQPPLYDTPGESNHDAFWIANCSRAVGFYPERDVYDVYYDHNLKMPTFRDIGKYKNIIWTYSGASTAWAEMIRFTPESMIVGRRTVNILPIYLALGGHIWTLGRSERRSGLAAAFPQYIPPLMPALFVEDMAPDPADASGALCMPYADYCVTMVDKIWGQFRTNPDEIPPNYRRSLDRDAMQYAYKDDTDFITEQYPDLPGQLELWEEVTKPGRFFDPQDRGFIYCEIYDPQYYMDFTFKTSQACFHPIYRMRARSSLSFINDQAIAVWITKYEDVIPAVESGIAAKARSVHFGFPLWFFKRDAVDDIVAVVFDEWRILESP